MGKRLTLLMLSLALAAFAAAGCGDDEESSGGGGDNSSQAAPKEDSGASDTPKAGGPATKQAVENCKQTISAQPQLSADVKSDLEEICEEAATGDEAAVRKASKDVCKKIVEETAPAGPAREQALAACDQATQTP